jgi:hypothetical protein
MGNQVEEKEAKTADDQQVSVETIVMPGDLLFPLEKLSGTRCTITVAVGTKHEKRHDCNPTRKNIFQRWLARHVAASILNGGGTYQMSGYTGSLKKSYESVDADHHQLAHWILRRVGYVCCCADLMKITGTEEA